MTSEDGIRTAIRESRSHPLRKLIIAVIAIVAVMGALLFVTSPSFFQNGEQENVAFVSEADLGFQNQVRNITGYDWTNFRNAGDDEKSKTAAMLFLANEIGVLGDNFNFVNRSAGLKKSELHLTRMNATDTGKNNLLTLVGNTKAINGVFAAKGVNSANTRVNRLSALEGFFARYGLPEGEIITSLFAEILGLQVDDYKKLVSLMIVNYNLFVTA